jgi:hypothetical protein
MRLHKWIRLVIAFQFNDCNKTLTIQNTTPEEAIPDLEMPPPPPPQSATATIYFNYYSKSETKKTLHP